MKEDFGERSDQEGKGLQDARRSEEMSRSRRGGYGRREHSKGAKTFRRGRAIEFLDRLSTRRAVLKQQLESPEFQSINPILIGELKAIETVIAEFTQLFEIHPDEAMQQKPVSIGEEKSLEDTKEK